MGLFFCTRKEILFYKLRRKNLVKEELLINLLTGRTNREVAEIIANKFASGAAKARRLVRTESNFISSELNHEAYKEAGIEEYQYLATLDLRTSEICRELDGKIFKVSERKVGVNCNPMHPWRRSTTIPVVDREFLNDGTRSARNPVTGKVIKVPASMNYKEWYEKFVEGSSKAKVAEKKLKNKSADRKQYERYRRILGNNVPDNLDDFLELKYNDDEKWSELQGQYKVVNRYDIVSGKPSVDDICKLDTGFKEEKSYFSSRFRSQGNIAVAEYGSSFYVAHSKIKDENSLGYKNYKGNAEIVLEKQKRCFKTKILPENAGWDRKVDSEAKIFEHINAIENKTSKTLNMMTYLPMCDSCIGVLQQFCEKYPDIQVNVIQRKAKMYDKN